MPKYCSTTIFYKVLCCAIYKFVTCRSYLFFTYSRISLYVALLSALVMSNSDISNLTLISASGAFRDNKITVSTCTVYWDSVFSISLRISKDLISLVKSGFFKKFRIRNFFRSLRILWGGGKMVALPPLNPWPCLFLHTTCILPCYNTADNSYKRYIGHFCPRPYILSLAFFRLSDKAYKNGNQQH